MEKNTSPAVKPELETRLCLDVPKAAVERLAGVIDIDDIKYRKPDDA